MIILKVIPTNKLKTVMKMTPKEKSEELFQKHYQILIEADSDASAEIMISTLSIKTALLTVTELIKWIDTEVHIEHGMNRAFWQKVMRELEKM